MNGTVARVRALLVIVCALLGAAVLAPGATLADSMALSVNPAPVADLASQIGYTASSEEGALAVIAANNPGVPCAAAPAADQGQTLTPPHLFEGGATGPFSGAVNWTPPTSGEYTLCGWLEQPAGLIETDGGPVTAETTLPIVVRAPRITLKLAFPRTPQPLHGFTLDLTASSEAAREVVVEGMPLTRRGCPVNYAAEEHARLFDRSILGGPWKLAANVEALRAGSYLFCAWADQAEDGGLYPEATASIVLHLGQPVPSKRRRPVARSATRAEFGAIDRLLAPTERTLHVALRWARVSGRGPFALAYLRGARQVSAVVLRGTGSSWRSLAAISDEGLRCGLVPPAIVAELGLERYNEGPHPCSP